MDLNKSMSNEPQWSKAYTLTFKSTQAMEFQLKFLHRRIAINHFLTKIGLETTLLICKFCGDGKEGLAHLLPNLLTFLLTCT